MNLADHPLSLAVAAAIGEREVGLVVGVSGGADSVALFRAVTRSRPPRSRIVVAHLDHELRADSAADATWVEQLAAAQQVPICVARRDVGAVARQEGIGLEEAARRCRYEFLGHVAAQYQCARIALAHTADDQAETVLHHLLRGTGLSGLRGMPKQRPLAQATLIRPLLQVTRSDVLDYLSHLEQPFLLDHTNEELAYTRNRIRRELLPLLREQFNPRVSNALERLSQQARDVQDLINDLAGELLRSAGRESTPVRVLLNVDPLRNAHRHLVREALRLLFTQHDWPRKRMGFDAWDRLADLAQTAQVPKSLTLPEGLAAHYRRGVLTIERT